LQVSQAGEELTARGPGKDVMRFESPGGDLEWADLRSAVGWIRSNKILLAAIVLIVAQLAWKSQFLGHLYFRQDDFHDLDLAYDHPLNWRYLTFIGAGHMIIGLRIIAWVLVRSSSSTYNWLLASIVSLAFVTAASMAAYRMLRDLFGNRPGILVPLAVYVLSPLTLPDLGIWSSAMESVPLQLATFMAVSAHLRYVRTGRRPHMLAAAFWIAFGLLFFEKGLVLPLLLFGLTAAFLIESRSLLGGCFSALRRYWQAWLLYVVLDVVYVLILVQALHTSTSQPKVPVSASGVLTFAWELVRDTLLPGMVGGPWQWFPVEGGSFSFAAPPSALVAISVIVVIALAVASVWLRPVAWRAWLILAGWVLAADILPVAIGRLDAFNAPVLGLETRYVADATPVIAICIGLAVLPLVTDNANVAVGRRRRRRIDSQQLRLVAAGLAGLFLFSSIWSVQAYEGVTNGTEASNYIANSKLALAQAPRGTVVADRHVPQSIVIGTFYGYAFASKVVGYMERGALKGKLRWLRSPHGTVDNLMIFGPDGRLYPVWVYGASSARKPSHPCFPVRRNRIKLYFNGQPPPFADTLRIGYIWPSYAGNSMVLVRYGDRTRTLAVRPGVHSGYVPISGRADGVVISGLGGARMCVGDVQAGDLGPGPGGPVFPALPKSAAGSS
jgi:hypothetical protein